jgi:protein-tyrosine phosphatase
VRVLFVCLGNICRSPTAEAVMRAHVEEAGLTGRIEVDSAGTGPWHVGEPPDERARAEAERRGVPMVGRGRQVHADDFAWFDLILAMDDTNAGDLRYLAPSAEAEAKVRLLREFDPVGARRPGDDLSVPDPYPGGEGGFAEVFELVDEACRGLLDHLRRATTA